MQRWRPFAEDLVAKQEEHSHAIAPGEANEYFFRSSGGKGGQKPLQRPYVPSREETEKPTVPSVLYPPFIRICQTKRMKSVLGYGKVAWTKFGGGSANSNILEQSCFHSILEWIVGLGSYNRGASCWTP
jgi:hypothetical protein